LIDIALMKNLANSFIKKHAKKDLKIVSLQISKKVLKKLHNINSL